MEKRWSERKLLSVGVDVYQHGKLLGSCISRDFGLGGTFLGADPSLKMSKDTDVELVFHLTSPEHSSRHKINARVTRTSDEGTGFKFCNFDTGVFRSLQEIMTYKPSSEENNIAYNPRTH